MTELRQILIADYDVILPNGNLQKGAYHGLSELNEIFRRSAVIPQWPTYDLRLPNDPSAPAKLSSMLARASAVFVPGASGIFDNESGVNALEEKLHQGMRLWVTVPRLPMRLEGRELLLSNFLTSHGITPTQVGVFSLNLEYGHQRVFALARDTYRHGFRDAQLFRGVDRVLFQQAHGLRLTGDAYSSASVLPGDYDIVDMASDYFVDWNEPDMSLIAQTFVGNNGGCIVATSGLVTADPYVGAMGHSFPGAAENSSIVSNVVRFLLQSAIPREPATESVVHGLVQKIERNLLETVRLVLTSEGGHWTDKVSDAAKAKGRQRSASGGGQFPWEAYLDLADHLNTITRNIDAFSPLLTSLGLPVSRNQIEKHVFDTGRLIELRILDSHATRRLIIDHSFSDEDLDFLRRIDQTVIRLWRAAMARTPT